MRNLSSNNDSQASVIGTIMAIMVVLAFLAFFTEQYIPAAMLENEAHHMDEVEAQLGAFKQTLDNLIISENTVLSTYSVVTLGSNNIAVFSVPSAGELAFDSNTSVSAMEVDFKIPLGNSTERINETSRGYIRFFGANRYYIQQYMIFENGALIISQREGNVMRATPSFSITNNSGNIEVECMLVTMIGQTSIVSGTGTTGITSHLSFHDSWKYTDISSDMKFNITTRYPKAWAKFFNTTASDAGLINGLDYWCYGNYEGEVKNLTVRIANPAAVTIQRAAVDVSVGAKEGVKT